MLLDSSAGCRFEIVEVARPPTGPDPGAGRSPGSRGDGVWLRSRPRARHADPSVGGIGDPLPTCRHLVSDGWSPRWRRRNREAVAEAIRMSILFALLGSFSQALTSVLQRLANVAGSGEKRSAWQTTKFLIRQPM